MLFLSILHTKNLRNGIARCWAWRTGFSDSEWTEYQTEGVTRFAVEHVGYPRSDVENQPIMISFRVADIQLAVETLAARGVRFYPSAEETIFEVGPSLVATFLDPAGNWVQLSQRSQPKG